MKLLLGWIGAFFTWVPLAQGALVQCEGRTRIVSVISLQPLTLDTGQGPLLGVESSRARLVSNDPRFQETLAGCETLGHLVYLITPEQWIEHQATGRGPVQAALRLEGPLNRPSLWENAAYLDPGSLAPEPMRCTFQPSGSDEKSVGQAVFERAKEVNYSFVLAQTNFLRHVFLSNSKNSSNGTGRILDLQTSGKWVVPKNSGPSLNRIERIALENLLRTFPYLNPNSPGEIDPNGRHERWYSVREMLVRRLHDLKEMSNLLIAPASALSTYSGLVEWALGTKIRIPGETAAHPLVPAQMQF